MERLAVIAAAIADSAVGMERNEEEVKLNWKVEFVELVELKMGLHV